LYNYTFWEVLCNILYLFKVEITFLLLERKFAMDQDVILVIVILSPQSFFYFLCFFMSKCSRRRLDFYLSSGLAVQRQVSSILTWFTPPIIFCLQRFKEKVPIESAILLFSRTFLKYDISYLKFSEHLKLANYIHNVKDGFIKVFKCLKALFILKLKESKSY
jgi:hypothetical protein